MNARLGHKLLKHRPLWLCKCFVNFGIKFYFLKLTQDPDELFKCHQLSLKVEDDFFLFLLFLYLFFRRKEIVC